MQMVQFATVTGLALLTDKQKLWCSILRRATSMRPQRLVVRPKDRLRIRASRPCCLAGPGLAYCQPIALHASDVLQPMSWSWAGQHAVKP